MISKQPIFPQRVRKIPRQFSWLDHRLVHDRHIEQCTHAAAALYLFLVTVSDARGLSYYGDDSIMNRLGMDLTTLEQARNNLVHIGLIAWKKPLYQVLSLDTFVKEPVAPTVMDTSFGSVESAINPVVKESAVRTSMGTPMSLKDIFKHIGGTAP